MMKYKVLFAAVSICSFIVVAPVFLETRETEKNDREQIIAHIHSIFQAYVREDTAAIRVKHTDDWRGFQNNSREILRGIDAYMQNPVRNLSRTKMLEYEIEDIEVQVYGDVAIVYYIANWKSLLKQSNRKIRTRARSIDIYRRDAQGWNQAGSHLSVLPSPASRGNPDCLKCVDIQFVTE
jgi:ketosteroid isomerase-like protein